MQPRLLQPKLKQLASKFPVVTLTGPRQSGKTTLCKMTFPKFDYVSLESLDNREEAIKDPRGFLGKFSDGVILDEIQRAPDLPSYIQELVDSGKSNFILTGSEQFRVTSTINQSLAGRTAVLRLLPFSYSEIYSEHPSISELLYRGFYPRVFNNELEASDFYSSYLGTYVERDVRSLANIRNITAFESFLKLVAANVGQLLDYTRLANDIGVDQKTIKAWISILEASFVCFRLPPHLSNYRKRITKSPKLYFYDVGLAAYLLDIRKAQTLESHPLKGHLFENFLVTEILKEFWHRGDYRSLYFFRDSSGNEVDLVIENGGEVVPVEMKLGVTVSKEQVKGLLRFSEASPASVSQAYLVHGGEGGFERFGVRVVPRWAMGELVKGLS